MNRLERIKQIEEILLANNKGWTRAELAGGGLIWSGWISEPTEMVPWVRSWGDQVQVLEGVVL
ncbi:MAG: hypothetical protein JXA95_12910 [Spirochaetales bacterium]|nr:hypothetical protein [Spirochaetales bacterium]